MNDDLPRIARRRAPWLRYALVLFAGCASPWSGLEPDGVATKPDFEKQYADELEKSPLEKSPLRHGGKSTPDEIPTKRAKADGAKTVARHDASSEHDSPAELNRPGAPHSEKSIAHAKDSANLSVVAQAEYLRALDRAEITDPAERADILAALEATDPAYRTIMLRTLRAKRAPAPESRVAADRYEPRRPASRSYEDDEVEPAPLEGPRSGTKSRMQSQNFAERTRRDERVAPFEEQSQPQGFVQAQPAQSVRQATYQEPPAVAKPPVAALSVPTPQPPIEKSGREQLLAAIAMLERESSGATPGMKREIEQMRIKLLQALAGERDAALSVAGDMTAEQREFVNQQVYGLSTLLGEKETSLWSRRAAIATEHFQGAADRLAHSGGLLVRNLRLCSEIKAYGNFTPFSSASFRPGQDVLIYAELERFVSEQTERGYHTKFHAGYQIWNGQGKRVAERELGVAEEHCQNRRRDYFVSYVVRLPEQLEAGEYTLKLVIEDQLGGKIGESSFSLKIDGASIALPKPKE